MATLLMLVLFTTYIGLGIPDSLLGAAWPAIYQEFSLPISYASFITILISGGTMTSSYFSARVIRRFGTANVTACSTVLAAFGLLCFSLSGNMLALCLSAIPLGFGAGSIDAALNSYAATHYSAGQISFLHGFYGIGISLSPYLMSLALSDQSHWRNGYRIMSYIQLAIAVLVLLSLPLWKKLGEQQGDTPCQALSTRQILRIRGVKRTYGVFIFSCAIEALCLVWISTFLVDTKGLAVDRAAGLTTVYYVGITLGRFLSGLLAGKLSSIKIILLGQTMILIALVLLLLPAPIYVAALGLFLIGFGNGPLYPNMTHFVPQIFGKDASTSVLGVQLALSYASMMLSPLLFGLFAQAIGTHLLPGSLLLAFTGMVVCTLALLPMIPKQKS